MRPHRYDGSRRRSLYVTMRDGVRIAIDVHLPADHADGTRRPAMLHQTRYYRSIAVRRALRGTPLYKLLNPMWEVRREFLRRGFVWVDVCARGSGASFGTRPYPWAPDEVADGVELLDWIVAQPWSDGRVGSMGISYSGTASEHLGAQGHPALRAVAPTFALFDVYPDIAFPGGVHLSFFTETWGRGNQMLDTGDHIGAFGATVRHWTRGWRQDLDRLSSRLRGLGDRPLAERAARALVRAISPGVDGVDEDHDRSEVRAAIASHADNVDIHAGALRLTHRDDIGLSPGAPEATADTFSPHSTVGALRDAGVAVLSYSGWLDGAYPGAAAKRHRALGTTNSRLVLGNWDHGGAQDISPGTRRFAADWDHAAAWADFFERHVAERDPGGDDPKVRYYTMGAERWQTADTWPPPGFAHRPLHLADGGRLVGAEPPPAGSAPWRCDPEARTGHRSRWNTLIGQAAPVGYGDRRRAERHLLTFTTEPLDRPLEVTGHAVLRLWLTCDEPDVVVFCYIHDVAPGGRSEYVTEGMLRGLHRVLDDDPADPWADLAPHRTYLKAHARPLEVGEPTELVIPLLPVSYQLGRGHRLRVAIAGGDADHFAVVGSGRQQLTVLTGGAHPSRLELPARDR